MLLLCTLLLLLPMPASRWTTRLARCAMAALAAFTMSAQASCGDPASAPTIGAEAGAVDGAVGTDSTLLLSLRDTVLTVGATSLAEVTDPQFLSAGRLRFLASPVQWSSSDTAVATVDAEGQVRAVSPGTVHLRASWRDRFGVRALRVVAVAAPNPETPPTPTPPTPQTPPPAAGIPTLPAGSPAELPRAYVDYPLVDGSGRTFSVHAGESIQDAIDAAQPGDVILLDAGATYAESIILKRKQGDGWITIRTEGTPTPIGVRVSLSDTINFARLHSRNGSPTVSSEVRTSGYRLVNLHITASPTRTSHNTLVSFGGNGETVDSYDKLPRKLVIDRSIVRGRPDLTLRRCISLQSAETAIANSLILECHEKGADSQGIGGWNGSGPFLIENNRIEGAGQNILFGGAHPSIIGLHPSDIVIRRNHFRKPGEWNSSKRWTIKNHLQFKHAQRVLIYHNLLEGNWGDAQTGSSIAISSSNQSGGPTTWAESRDISIFENVIRETGRGMVLAARGSGAAARSVHASRILVAGNLLYRLGPDSPFGGRGDPVTILGALAHVMIVENTFNGHYNSLGLPTDGDPPRTQSMTYERNVAAFGTYGIFGGGIGLASIEGRYAPVSFTSNCFFGVTNRNYAPPASYPAPNVATEETVTTALPRISTGDPTVGAASACKGIPLNAGERLGARTDLVQMLEAWVVPGLQP